MARVQLKSAKHGSRNRSRGCKFPRMPISVRDLIARRLASPQTHSAHERRWKVMERARLDGHRRVQVRHRWSRKNEEAAWKTGLDRRTRIADTRKRERWYRDGVEKNISTSPRYFFTRKIYQSRWNFNRVCTCDNIFLAIRMQNVSFEFKLFSRFEKFLRNIPFEAWKFNARVRFGCKSYTAFVR